MKQLFTIILCYALLSIFPVSALAHQGKTDSSGGHYDHSIGEYHYHHGYPAHEHYDMDGDGDIDCPHDFVDKTDHSSGSSTASSSKTPSGSYSNSSTSTRTNPQNKEVKKVPFWVYFAIGIQAAIVLICFRIIRTQNHEIDDIRSVHNDYAKRSRELFVASVNSRYTQTLDKVATANKELDDSLPASAKINFRDPFPLNFYEDFDNRANPFDLPYGVTITKTGEAALGYIDKHEPFGKYTVFITYTGHCYHRSPYCSHISSSHPACILSVANYRSPCSFCRPPSVKSIPKWYLNFISASRFFNINWKEYQQQAPIEK